MRSRQMFRVDEDYIITGKKYGKNDFPLASENRVAEL